jgi:hypothetical protein
MNHLCMEPCHTCHRATVILDCNISCLHIHCVHDEKFALPIMEEHKKSNSYIFNRMFSSIMSESICLLVVINLSPSFKDAAVLFHL